MSSSGQLKRELKSAPDAPILEQVAQDLIGHFGLDAEHYVREQAEIAVERGDVLTVDTWCDIAETINRLL